MLSGNLGYYLFPSAQNHSVGDLTLRLDMGFNKHGSDGDDWHIFRPCQAPPSDRNGQTDSREASI